MAAITAENVTKRYGARTALAGVSFSVEPGEIVALLGPNGAGKSTMLSIVATLLVADTGRVTVVGHVLPREAAAARRVLGLVPQQVAVYPTLTPAENLAFFARMFGLHGARMTHATAEALALVGLERRANDPVATLSGGMRRRLNLACGILHRPRVVLLDEPSVGVDPQSREHIFGAIQRLAHEGAAVLYSTHYMEEAEQLCSRVVLIDSGRVVAAGTPDDLITRAGMVPRLKFRTARPLPSSWLAGVAGARPLELADGEMSVALTDARVAPAVLAAVTRAGGEVLTLALHRPNLADLFFHLTGRALRDADIAGTS